MKRVWREFWATFRLFGTVRGRARRREFWMFILWGQVTLWLLFLLGYGGSLLHTLGATTWSGAYYGFGYVRLLYVLCSLALIVPTFCTAVRRLHDTGRTGRWLLLYLIPALVLRDPARAAATPLQHGLALFAALIAFVVVVVFLAQQGQQGTNRYGPPVRLAAPLPGFGPTVSPAES